MKQLSYCDDCAGCLTKTGQCYCITKVVPLDASKLKFPRGSRFGVYDIQEKQMVLTTDSINHALGQAQSKGYFRFVIQP